jgi:phage shock protein PspC (stress-responsive transcriptional regulator)
MSEHITHTPSIKRLERSTSDRMVSGVAAGLGRYFDINPGVFRLGFVVLTLLGGAGILVYLTAVLVMPSEGEEKSVAARILEERRDRPVPLVALGFVGIAIAVLLSRGDLWPAAGTGWVLILIIGVIVLWASRKERRSGRLIAVVAGLFSLLAVALVTAVVVAFAWFNVSLSDGVGSRSYTPASAADLRSNYKVGIGSLKLDLTDVDPRVAKTVKLTVGVGEIDVYIPSGAAVSVDAHAKGGQVDVFDQHDDGRNAVVKTSGGPGLVLKANVGAGHIDIRRTQ